MSKTTNKESFIGSNEGNEESLKENIINGALQKNFNV
jgi:hypothetical protein